MTWPVDHPIRDTWLPPNGWGCKCWVLQVTREEAESVYDYRPDDPEPYVPTRPYINKRTGALEHIPVGVDPGWQTNPGKFRDQNLRRFLAERLDAAPDALRDAAIRDTVTSWLFRRIQGGDFHGAGAAPVAILPQRLQEALGAQTRTVWFSTEAAGRQARRRELAPEDYAMTQRLLDGGMVTEEAPGRIVAYGEIDGAWWKAIVKMTAKGDELYLTTLRRTHPRQAEKAASRGLAGGGGSVMEETKKEGE